MFFLRLRESCTCHFPAIILAGGSASSLSIIDLLSLWASLPVKAMASASAKVWMLKKVKVRVKESLLAKVKVKAKESVLEQVWFHQATEDQRECFPDHLF